LFTASLATAASTFTLGKELGIDPQRLGEILSDGTANSFALSTIAPMGGSREVLAGHADGLLRKDVGLIGDLAARAAAQRGPVVTAADATLALMAALR
jgi:3-hydroxyisobutyrate dehydrogenase-like beta-hydroxyacid dehydrogenase